MQVKTGGKGILLLSGELTVGNFTKTRKQLSRASSGAKILDVSGVTSLDTAGAMLLLELGKQGFELQNISPKHKTLLDTISGLKLTPITEKPRPSGFVTFVSLLGKKTIDGWKEMLQVIAFGGQTAVTLLNIIRNPRYLRLPDIARHIREIGIDAIPIISFMAFMISIVLAYQGVAQLRPYGGERFTVNLVTLSLLREMGVLLTSIMVAGRSGSAFAAEIGVMKAREEVDALQVIGIAPFGILVMPRMIALMITLPLLTFLADIMGLLGGSAISIALLDMNLTQYIHQVHEAARLKDFYVGLIKAPVFAFFIGTIGCMHGLRVSGSAESVGKETTASVVKSIFLVLMLDALFSIFFQKIGW
jgi:phospholipid/cholesterol/gamma-HCH transport system permease protein